MKKVIVKLSINGNVIITEAIRDMRTLYKAGSSLVRSAKNHNTRARFRVYDFDNSNLCLLAMFSACRSTGDWTARLSRSCHYGGSSGLEL